MNDVTRRSLLAGSLAAGAGLAGAALLPGARQAQAKAPLADKQAPGFYRFKVGDFEVTTLHDGARSFPYSDGFVSNVSKDTALAAAKSAYMPDGMVTVPFNPTLINTGSKLVLIDVGNGPVPNAPVGMLFANLAAAGVDPKDIDIVVLSHFHPDHINGLKTAEGAVAFPNAEIKAPSADWAFWMNDENMAKAASPMMRNYFANTRKILGGMDDRIARFDWGAEVGPGITAVDAHGHTPGHTAFAVASGSKHILVQSDVTNIPEFFLQNPDWHVAYDADPDEAQKTRHKIYDMAAAEKMTVVGFHFSFPSVGHIEKAGSGYRLVPVAWNAVL